MQESIPITFVYGRHDWMDVEAGELVKATIEASQANEQVKQCNVHIVNDCGHQLYIENPVGFNRIVLQYCQPRELTHKETIESNTPSRD